MTMQDAVQDYLNNKWNKPSQMLEAKVAESSPPNTDLVSAEEQQMHLRQWARGLRMLEQLLIDRAYQNFEKVPIVAPAMVSEAVHAFARKTMVFVGGASSVYKAFVQLYGYNATDLTKITEVLHVVMTAVLNVATDAMLVVMGTAKDAQTGMDKPALHAWTDRFNKSAEIWGALLKDATPEKLPELAVMYQAKLMEYAISLNPKLAQLPPVEDADLEKFSKTSGIPVDRLRELLKRPAKVEETKVDKPPEGKQE